VEVKRGIVIQFEEIDPVLSLHGLDDAQRHERSETLSVRRALRASVSEDFGFLLFLDNSRRSEGIGRRRGDGEGILVLRRHPGGNG
jgi:hypothetical protein